MHNYKKAFTLVELIVVIVILSILATIAFLSFSSQSASARDSTRLSDMSNIAKGLSVFNATSGSYPKPDSFITITASGAAISFQGKAGNGVLNMIKISNGGKDPLDNSSFYTYSTNAGQNKFQILGFLEDGSSSALSMVPISFAADYSKRFTITKGDNIGILLSSGTLDPAENKITTTFTGIDLITTVDAYSIKFDKDTSITGTGIILRSGLISTSGLIGYWDMESLSGTLLKDLSLNGNDGTLNGTTSTGGKIGNAKYFNGSSDYITLPNSQSFNGQMNSITVNAWVKMNTLGGLYEIVGRHTDGNNAQGSLRVDESGKIQFLLKGSVFSNTVSNKVIADDVWHLITGTYDGSNVKIYIDGNLDVSKPLTGSIASCPNSSQIGSYIGNSERFKGYIDEVRIYNRALLASEIQTLYSSNR